MTMKNWWRHLNLLNIYLIICVPLLGLWAAWYTPLTKYTLIWSVLYYFNTGLGITAGKQPPPLPCHRSVVAAS